MQAETVLLEELGPAVTWLLQVRPPANTLSPSRKSGKGPQSADQNMGG